MTDINVTVVDETGTVFQQIIIQEGKTPAQCGFPVSPKYRFFTVPKAGDVASEVFNVSTGKWEKDPAKVELALIEKVKDEAERRKMTMATPGGMKKTEYAEKRAEVMAWKTLGSAAGTILAAFNLLPMATRQTKFAHVLADSAAFGDGPAEAVARFEAGMSKAAPTAQVAATEAKACSDIRKATTAAAKEAVYAAIVWP